MEALKKQVETLESTKGEKEQVKILRKINRLILTDYMIQIDEDFCLYPIEVEAYYYHEDKFKDPYPHQHELQKDHYRKLYFHRANRKRKKEDPISWGNYGGVDICLSFGDYYLGILIRSTWINEEKEPVCGPNLLKKRIIRRYTGKKDEDHSNITPEEFDKIRELEEKENVLVLATKDDPRADLHVKKDEYPIIEGNRFGIEKEKDILYFEYNLRALIGLKIYPFNDKERMIISYFKESDGKVTWEKIVKILGWKSQKVYDYFNKKESK
jgi:hypothetical protein